MGMSLPQLSRLLNTQPNMTLETIARFELALDVELTLTFDKEAARADSCDREECGSDTMVLRYDQIVPAHSIVASDGVSDRGGSLPGGKLRLAA